MRFVFDATLWRWDARNDVTWVFVTVPEALSDEIEQLVAGREGGFGSVKVKVALGGSRWSTSLFPSNAEGAYILPMKKSVRAAESIDIGDSATIEIELVGI